MGSASFVLNVCRWFQLGICTLKEDRVGNILKVDSRNRMLQTDWNWKTVIWRKKTTQELPQSERPLWRSRMEDCSRDAGLQQSCYLGNGKNEAVLTFPVWIKFSAKRGSGIAKFIGGYHEYSWRVTVIDHALVLLPDWTTLLHITVWAKGAVT